MTTYEPLSPPRTVGDDASASSRLGKVRGLWAWVANWVGTCADYYEAAAMYEEMHRLSDAELARRGLDRPDLARDLLEACDRTGHASKARCSKARCSKE